MEIVITIVISAASHLLVGWVGYILGAQHVMKRFRKEADIRLRRLEELEIGGKQLNDDFGNIIIKERDESGQRIH